MKRVLLVFLLVAILLAGCKQKGFETDINLASSSQSEETTKPKSSSGSTAEDDENRPPQTSASSNVSGEQPAGAQTNLPAVVLPDSALTDVEMTDIYGLVWDDSADSKLEPVFTDLNAGMPQMSLYRSCYLLNINPLYLSTYAGWYVNTNGTMVLYFTYPSSSQSYMKTALAKAAGDLKSLLQPQFEASDHKARFDNIRFEAGSTKAYFIIPDGWSGETVEFRHAFLNTARPQLQVPPFPTEKLTETTPYVQLAADQMEYEVITALGFSAKPGLGVVNSSMQVSDYLGEAPKMEVDDGSPDEDADWVEGADELDDPA